jgi:cytochrome c-type biogenesis protein
VFLIVYYVSRTNLFYQDRRIQVSSRLQNRGYLTSAIMGTVFAAGWTPCTGPNLALALTVAGSSSTAGEGAALLSTYAMGLGIPFLIVGFAFGSATRLMRRLTPYMGWIKLVNMVLLLAMAVLIASNALASLSGQGTFLQSIFDINL